MPRSISKPYLTEKLRKLRRLTMRLSNRFLASTSSNTQVQQQKLFNAPTAFRIPKIPNKQSRPKQTQPYRPKTQTQTIMTSNRKDFIKRSSTPNSSPPLNLPLPPQSSESQPFPLPVLPSLDISVGGGGGGGVRGRSAHFVEQREEFTDNKLGPLCRAKWFQDTIQVNASPVVSSDQTVSRLHHYSEKRSTSSSRNGQWKGYKIGELLVFIPGYSLYQKRMES